jgi:hypothetical protein
MYYFVNLRILTVYVLWSSVALYSDLHVEIANSMLIGYMCQYVVIFNAVLRRFMISVCQVIIVLYGGNLDWVYCEWSKYLSYFDGNISYKKVGLMKYVLGYIHILGIRPYSIHLGGVPVTSIFHLSGRSSSDIHIPSIWAEFQWHPYSIYLGGVPVTSIFHLSGRSSSDIHISSIWAEF